MKKFTDIVNENKTVENNDNIVESIDSTRVSELYSLCDILNEQIENVQEHHNLTDTEYLFVLKTCVDKINEIINSVEDTKNDKSFEPETGYGTSHLANQGVSLGKILTEVTELVANSTYCIVDLGLNEWNGGNKYLGYNDFDGNKYHQFQNTLDQHQLGEPDMYTDEEISEMIENGQIAFEG